MKRFRIHVGFTKTGRDRWRYFATFADAVRAAQAVFARTGIVLTIEQEQPK